MQVSVHNRAHRAATVRESLTRHKAIRDNIAANLHARKAEVEALSEKVETLAKVGELLRLLVDRLVSEQRKIVEGLVTEGLQTVFHDQALSFEADVVQRAGRVEIDLFLRRGAKEAGIRGDPLEAFGGGPTSITSLLLRIIALRRMGRKPFLLLDESLAAVSDEYVDATGKLLYRLCESMGLDVLLVTHKPSFLEHAASAYQATEETVKEGSVEAAAGEGVTRLGLRRLRSKAS